MEKDTSKNIKTAETAASKAEVAHDQASKKEQKTAKEPIYSVNELASNAKKIFGTRPECVFASLKAAGKSKCTVSEAQEIMKKFLKREVE